MSMITRSTERVLVRPRPADIPLALFNAEVRTRDVERRATDLARDLDAHADKLDQLRGQRHELTPEAFAAKASALRDEYLRDLAPQVESLRAGLPKIEADARTVSPKAQAVAAVVNDPAGYTTHRQAFALLPAELLKDVAVRVVEKKNAAAAAALLHTVTATPDETLAADVGRALGPLFDPLAGTARQLVRAARETVDLIELYAEEVSTVDASPAAPERMLALVHETDAAVASLFDR